MRILDIIKIWFLTLFVGSFLVGIATVIDSTNFKDFLGLFLLFFVISCIASSWIILFLILTNRFLINKNINDKKSSYILNFIHFILTVSFFIIYSTYNPEKLSLVLALVYTTTGQFFWILGTRKYLIKTNL